MGIRPKDILLHMQVPDRPGLYVLGAFESRVTIYSQQVRALNLIYSLSQEKWKNSPTKVAIIGAGISGLTAGVAASCCGAAVTILEQLSEPLALIGQSNKRWLHPHIYEWPKEDADLPNPLDNNAHLPLLNWHAGTVDQVRKQLIEHYKRFEESFNIDLRPHVADVSILAGNSERFSLTWNEPVNHIYPHDARRNRTLQCDIVILAVGFGLEQRFEGIPFSSYWSTDKIDEEDASIHGRAKRILVSGTGDGGLIDLLRIRLKDFSHHNMVDRLTRELLDPANLEWLTDRLLALEAEAERAVDEQKPYAARLNEEYQNLTEELINKVDILSHVGLRTDTLAVLTSRDDYPLSLRTSILNRLLYSLLPDVKYLKGPWTPHVDENGSIRVTFDNGTTEVFDEIIIRHGPDSALRKYYPDIWDQCAPLKVRGILDQTRFPIYQEFFDGCTSSILSETKDVEPISKSLAGSTTNAAAKAAPHVPSAPISVTVPPPTNVTHPPRATPTPIPPYSEVTTSPFIVHGGVQAHSITYLPRRCDSQIQTALTSEPLIAISGDYQIGKSSLLNQLEILTHSGWKICRFDLQGMRTDNSTAFFKEFFGMLSDCIRITHTWESLSSYTKEHPLALLFDEFGTLADMGPDCMALIRKLTWIASIHPAQVRVVVCLPGPVGQFVKQYDPNPKYSQLWHSITIYPFEREEEIIEIFNLLPHEVGQVARNNCRTILQKSSGYPNRLQFLCDRLFQEAGINRGEEHLISIINDLKSYGL